MKRTKEISVTITMDAKEEMFSVDTCENESGCTASFGPTPMWSDWRESLKEMIGNEIISWIELMMDEEEDE